MWVPSVGGTISGALISGGSSTSRYEDVILSQPLLILDIFNTPSQRQRLKDKIQQLRRENDILKSHLEAEEPPPKPDSNSEVLCPAAEVLCPAAEVLCPAAEVLCHAAPCFYRSASFGGVQPHLGPWPRDFWPMGLSGPKWAYIFFIVS